MALPQTVRKVAGTAMLVIFVPFYALFVMSIAGARMPGASILTQTVFFAIAGLIWIVPAGAIIAWMLKTERPPDRREG